MQQRIAGCLKEVTKVYLIIILVLLPLYMKDRMVMIGDAKYFFFRNATLLFLAVIAFGMALYAITGGWKQMLNCFSRNNLSVLDCFVLAYGITSIVSCTLAEDLEIAIWGYADWHLGVISQLLFVSIYFVVSRLYSGSEDMWETAGIAAVIVFLLGVLNRFQVDLLGIYTGMAENDWNRYHLLSTIGNNNWYCGYISVTAGIFIYLFYSRQGISKVIAGLGVVLTFTTLLTQGSESGYVLVAGVLAILCYVSLSKRATFLRFLETVLLFPTVCLVLQGIHAIAPKLLIMDDEGTEGIWALWSGWSIVFLVLGILYVWFRVRWRHGLEENCRFVKPIRMTMVVCVCAGVIVFIAWGASGRNMNWGTARGALWYLSIRSFIEGSWKQRFIGAGPDCFATHIYESYNPNDMVQVAHRWQNVVYTSAHNEWLNMLVTQGLFGLVAYVGIFVSGFVRAINRVEAQPVLLLGLLALGGYAANATVSFQHVMATPFIFVMLGMMEAAIRHKEI